MLGRDSADRAQGRRLKRFRSAEQEKTMNKGTKGAILASAVAALFFASAAMAQEPGAAPSGGAQNANMKCIGANACKGKSSCKSAQNDCKGKNACKGKGFVMTSSPDECTQKGGHLES